MNVHLRQLINTLTLTPLNLLYEWLFVTFKQKITGIGPQGKPWTQSLRGKPRGIDLILPALRSETKACLPSARQAFVSLSSFGNNEKFREGLDIFEKFAFEKKRITIKEIVFDLSEANSDLFSYKKTSMSFFSDPELDMQITLGLIFVGFCASLIVWLIKRNFWFTCLFFSVWSNLAFLFALFTRSRMFQFYDILWMFWVSVFVWPLINIFFIIWYLKKYAHR